MCAVSCVRDIVDEAWLIDSAEQHALLDTNGYLASDRALEAKHRFVMYDTLHDPRKVLEGRTVYLVGEVRLA